MIEMCWYYNSILLNTQFMLAKIRKLCYSIPMVCCLTCFVNKIAFLSYLLLLIVIITKYLMSCLFSICWINNIMSFRPCLRWEVHYSRGQMWECTPCLFLVIGKGGGVWKGEDGAFLVPLVYEEKVQWEKRKPHRLLNIYIFTLNKNKKYI